MILAEALFRKKAFEDTIHICRTNQTVKESIAASRKKQFVVFDGPLSLKENKMHRGNKGFKVNVSRRSTLSAAKKYASEGKRVCILNFANAFTAGGGVKIGAKAQEEGLCRCSTLYECLTDDYMLDRYYDLHNTLRKKGRFNNLANDDCIYTPDVLVMKEDFGKLKLLPEKDWYKTDIITCAAPDLRKPVQAPLSIINAMKAVIPTEEEMKRIHEKRGKRILDIANHQNVDVIILGAFGCGAFCNDAKTVAEAYRNILDKCNYDFETIEFAVYAKDESDYNNRMFREILMDKQ